MFFLLVPFLYLIGPFWSNFLLVHYVTFLMGLMSIQSHLPLLLGRANLLSAHTSCIPTQPIRFSTSGSSRYCIALFVLNFKLPTWLGLDRRLCSTPQAWPVVSFGMVWQFSRSAHVCRPTSRFRSIGRAIQLSGSCCLEFYCRESKEREREMSSKFLRV